MKSLAEKAKENRRKDQRPNIIMIITDQQRYDTINALGYPFMETPNLDKLVNEGISFTNSFVMAPSCAPSRASLFTGQYAHTTGVFINNRDPWTKTFVNDLSESGYYCVNVGKMHTSPWDAPAGFHERFEVENKDRFRADRWFYDEWDRALRIRGYKKPNREDYSKWPDYEERLGAYEWKLPEDLHPDNFVGDLAAWWIGNHDLRWWEKPTQARGKSIDSSMLEKPLFMQIGFPGPHPPYDPTESYIKKYAEKEIPIHDAPQESIENQPPAMKKLREIMLNNNPDGVKHLANPTSEQRRRQRAYYSANVSMIDTKIGEILESLEQHGYLENAVVIFTSDHGDSLGDHGHSEKWNMYDESVKVPTIFWSPNYFSRKGQRIDELVELFDICPTILEMAGINPPDWMEATSLLPLLRGDEGAKGKDFVISEHARDDFLPNIEFMTMIRDKAWKLVNFSGEEEGQLFHLEDDPLEFNDLWNDERYKDKKQEMLNKIRDWLIKSNVKTHSWRGMNKMP